MCVDRFHIVSLFLSNPCTPSTLSKEAFMYSVCPTEIPQPPFSWKYYESLRLALLRYTETPMNPPLTQRNS